MPGSRPPELPCLPGVEMQEGRVIIPVAMKRCVASRSCGEIFTLISESESLNKEKSCRFLSLCAILRGPLSASDTLSEATAPVKLPA